MLSCICPCVVERCFLCCPVSVLVWLRGVSCVILYMSVHVWVKGVSCVILYVYVWVKGVSCVILYNLSVSG